MYGEPLSLPGTVSLPVKVILFSLPGTVSLSPFQLQRSIFPLPGTLSLISSRYREPFSLPIALSLLLPGTFRLLPDTVSLSHFQEHWSFFSSSYSGHFFLFQVHWVFSLPSTRKPFSHWAFSLPGTVSLSQPFSTFSAFSFFRYFGHTFSCEKSPTFLLYGNYVHFTDSMVYRQYSMLCSYSAFSPMILLSVFVNNNTV